MPAGAAGGVSFGDGLRDGVREAMGEALGEGLRTRPKSGGVSEGRLPLMGGKSASWSLVAAVAAVALGMCGPRGRACKVPCSCALPGGGLAMGLAEGCREGRAEEASEEDAEEVVEEVVEEAVELVAVDATLEEGRGPSKQCSGMLLTAGSIHSWRKASSAEHRSRGRSCSSEATKLRAPSLGICSKLSSHSRMAWKRPSSSRAAAPALADERKGPESSKRRVSSA